MNNKEIISNPIIKCAIDNKCLQKSSIEATKFYNSTIKIINLAIYRKINDRALNSFEISYKKLEKILFEKKTIKCIQTYCSKYIKNKIEQLNKTICNLNNMKKTLRILKKDTTNKLSLKKIQNTQKFLDCILKMAKSFYKKFNKNFKKM